MINYKCCGMQMAKRTDFQSVLLIEVAGSTPVRNTLFKKWQNMTFCYLYITIKRYIMTKRNKWTEEEILFLKNNYEKIGAKKTNEILSGHTYNSIIKIAHTLNLKVDRSTYDINQLKNIVENSISYAEVFRKLNKISTGSSYKILKNTIKKHKIDTSHFDPYKNNRINIKQKPISFWLQNGTNIHSSHLKNKLYKEGLKIKKCEKCGQDENWHGEHMSLILDHINDAQINAV